MKLSYKILWFEDDTVSYNGKKEMVKAIVEDELGFHFPEPRNEINGDNIEDINYDDFDLLIADLNLAGTKGTALIDRIRHNLGIYTEVIFYSSEGEKAVRNALKEYEIDGAYCADRGEDFEDKVRKVIKTTVKKVQDLNNMRGLIMAETSDIDKIMFEIITKVLEKNTSGIGEKLKESIFANVNSKVNEKKDKFDKHNGKNIDRIIFDNLMFDASEKIKAVQFIIDAIEHDVTNPYKADVFKTSYSEITKKRNLLGHETQKPIDGKIMVGIGEHAFEFSDDFCIDMRRKVKKHSDDLDAILQMINS